MKIRHRNSIQPTTSRKSIYQYCISILLGAMLAVSIFVIKDFFSYHVHLKDGGVLKASIHEVFCASTEGLEKFVPKKNVPKVSILFYEALILTWLYQRADKTISSLLFGGSVGAMVTMARKQIITLKQPA